MISCGPKRSNESLRVTPTYPSDLSLLGLHDINKG